MFHRIWSVDPGFSEAGSVEADLTLKEDIAEINVDKISTQKTTDFGTDKVNLAHDVTLWTIKSYDEMVKKPDVVLVEDQYTASPYGDHSKWLVSRDLAVFQAVFTCTLNARFDVPVYSLISKHYKSELGITSIGSDAKDKHRENKKLAVEFCGNVTGRKFKFADNHICDAINQIYFFVQRTFPDKKIIIKCSY